MSIYLPRVRTAAMVARKNKLGGFFPDNSCELCMKVLRSDPVMLPMNHETYELLTDEEAEACGNRASLFPFGPDCAKRIRRLLAQ